MFGPSFGGVNSTSVRVTHNGQSIVCDNMQIEKTVQFMIGNPSDLRFVHVNDDDLDNIKVEAVFDDPYDNIIISCEIVEESHGTAPPASSTSSR